MSLTLWLFLLLYGRTILQIESVCTYPSDLRGEWYSSSNGLLTFENSKVFGLSNRATLIGTQNYSCEFTGTGNQHISKASTQFFSTVTGEVYLCMNFIKLSSVRYLMTYDSEFDSSTGERLVVILSGSNQVATANSICNLSETYPAGTHEILVSKDSASSASITCPSVLQSLFTLTIKDVSCQGAVLDGRTDASLLSITYSDCSRDLLFTADGQFSCMYSESVGSYTYLNVFNNDQTISEPTTYRYSCYVFEKEGRIIYLTQHPKICQPNQTPYNVSSTGRILILVDNDPDVDMGGQIAVGVIVGLVVVAVLVFGVLSFMRWYLYTRKKRIKPALAMTHKAGKRNWDILRHRFEEKAAPFDEIPKIINIRKKRRKRKAMLTKKDSFVTDLEVHEELNEEAECNEIELIVPPKSAIKRLPSMDRRKIVQWIDRSTTSTDFREKPLWQKDWESYRDPFNMEQAVKCATPSTSAYSVRTLSSIMNLGEISWYEPDKEEKSILERIWKRINRLLPMLARKKDPDY